MIPCSVIIIKSSVSTTSLIEIILPTFSVVRIVKTPLPPLFLNGYASIPVRLPNPFSLTARTVPDLLITIIPITTSPSLTLIPRTPIVFRPVGRTSDSLNLIALPFEEPSITSFEPSVSLASISLSPALISIAYMPPLIGLL